MPHEGMKIINHAQEKAPLGIISRALIEGVHWSGKSRDPLNLKVRSSSRFQEISDFK